MLAAQGGALLGELALAWAPALGVPGVAAEGAEGHDDDVVDACGCERVLLRRNGGRAEGASV